MYWKRRNKLKKCGNRHQSLYVETFQRASVPGYFKTVSFLIGVKCFIAADKLFLLVITGAKVAL